MNIDDLTLGQIKEIQGLKTGGGCPCPGGRVVLVVDRGWIFAGDATTTPDGYVRLTNAVHVFSWDTLGFAGMVADWKNSKVDLRKITDVEVPSEAIVFRVPVPVGWGLK